MRKRVLTADPELTFFASQPLRQAHATMTRLYPDDTFYFSARFAWVGPDDAKKIFLYGCAREVMKAGVTLTENVDHLAGVPQERDTLSRAVLAAFIDIQKVVARKLVETLVNLLLLDPSDRGEVYRILLSAEHLDDVLGDQADMRTFFGCQSGNLGASITEFSERITTDLQQPGMAQSAFLRDDWTKRVVPSVKRSVHQRYREALKRTSDDEKLVLGISYSRLFGDLSRAAHPGGASSTGIERLDPGTLRGNVSLISLLGQHVISRINGLLGVTAPQDIRSLAATGATVAPALMARWRQVFDEGDLVFAMNDICEVAAWHGGAYGYTSCQVRFLTRPPLPDAPTDWMPTAHVTRILPIRGLREFLFRDRNRPEIPDPLREALRFLEPLPDKELMSAVKEAMMELHRRGLLVPLLRRTSSGNT